MFKKGNFLDSFKLSHVTAIWNFSLVECIEEVC